MGILHIFFRFGENNKTKKCKKTKKMKFASKTQWVKLPFWHSHIPILAFPSNSHFYISIPILAFSPIPVFTFPYSHHRMKRSVMGIWEVKNGKWRECENGNGNVKMGIRWECENGNVGMSKWEFDPLCSKKFFLFHLWETFVLMLSKLFQQNF